MLRGTSSRIRDFARRSPRRRPGGSSSGRRTRRPTASPVLPEGPPDDHRRLRVRSVGVADVVAADDLDAGRPEGLGGDLGPVRDEASWSLGGLKPATLTSLVLDLSEFRCVC